MLMIDYLNIGLIVLLVVNQTSAVSYNQPKFCSFPSWNPNGITITNSSVTGNFYAAFVDANNTVYVSATTRKFILVWMEGSNYLTNRISTNLPEPRSIFVTNNGEVYVAYRGSNRVDKCSVKNQSCDILTYAQASCDGLFVDINNTIYCSILSLNQVFKTSVGHNLNISDIVAGNGTAGSASNMLNEPHGIFVDINFNLYVADTLNHRIQLFKPEHLVGITVAGGKATETIELNRPMGIVLDADGYLFIVDEGNHRIVGSGPGGFRCLVGCFGSGSASSQLTHPITMSFDSYGNFFVTDFFNARVQKFLLATNSCTVSYNRPKFSPCASWNPNAITFADNNTVGNRSYGIFVDGNDTIYVTNRQSKIVPIWSQGSTIPTRNLSGNLTFPRSIFVTIDGSVYVDNGKDGIVKKLKWTLNATNSEIVMNAGSHCYGLFVDIDNNLYCSMGDQNQVIKRSLYSNMNTTTIVAGNGSNGSASNQLSGPRGIFVDINLDLYVADFFNHRIQLFRSGQSNGTTIVGKGSSGSYALNQPHWVVLDGDGYLFIVDYGNHRIVAQGPTGFRCLVGCSGEKGSTASQLDFPLTMAFDSHGNIYVTDRDNDRIQKFILTINSCVQESFPFFVVSSCIDSSRIGFHCNISNSPCAMSQFCKNNGTCYDNGTGPNNYFCSCPPGFNGSQCQYDQRLCKPNPCRNNGQCNVTSETKFVCLCEHGWQGTHCQTMSNYCENVTCDNNGVCRTLFRNYTCECLGNSYSGRHCEITSTKIKIYRIVSKSFAYVAILVMISFAMFIIIMDILKYCFGIDLTREEAERFRREKQAKKRKFYVIKQFVYVNPSSSSNKPISIIEKTIV